ncbi:MAG TPA: DNA-formamidopyrimidine glycosylase [Phycisphaerae bacterium]|nr:DNA-formamidopyrimidine glycosylase [Phycisphaerae bacterium]
MPELPEVETIVRMYRPRLEGRRIRAFATRWAKNCKPSAKDVRCALVGQTIVRLTRRAKWIVFGLGDGSHLLVHLRMSGRFAWAAEQRWPPQHIRATWDLDDGHRLLFCDARKFGRIVHTRDLAAATADLGPEPLGRGFTPGRLGELLQGRRRQLKPLLLDQAVIAGLGNIYTDEALFRAGLHPLTRADQLTPGDVRRLHSAIRAVLRLAVRNHGTSIDWIYPDGWMQRRLAVYGRTGEPCRRCGTVIVALRVAQRGTHICPRCQSRRD